MKFWIACAIAIATFSGCASALTVCPPLKDYSMDWRGGLALELERLPQTEYPHLWEGVADYLTLRDQVRACQP